MKNQNIYTVGQVNSYIKNMFAQDYLLQNLSVKGEISNCKYHSSGHIYFTLKDIKGTISCVMFAGSRVGLSFKLAEGMQVIVKGAVAIYERDGKYQIYVQTITRDGEGVLYEKFERLKQELLERGMFDEAYKKKIPTYSSRVGIITAATGAAVRDIINITSRRNPYVQMILYPAIVQGEMAAESIVNGIQTMEKANVDVIIVGRGGGSIEDLWCFNEEIVAQAIFDCNIPIISAVGHETDVTIADYVADLRAPTPSAAAELAVCDILVTEQKILHYQNTMKRFMLHKIEQHHARLQMMRARIHMNSPLGKIREKKTYAISLEESLGNAMKKQILVKRHLLELYIEKLKGRSPLDKLKQGFSFTEDRDGRPISDVNQVKSGEELQIYVKNGLIHTIVTGTEAGKWE